MHLRRTPVTCKHASRPITSIFVVGWLLAFQSSPVNAGGEHACDYLTVGQVAEVLGFDVSQPERKPANPIGQTICFFDAPQEQGMRYAQLQLVATSSEAFEKTGFTVASMFQNNTGYVDKPQVVEGVGDEALWGGSGLHVGAGLHVHADDIYFVVLAKTADEQDSLAKSKQLAEIVLDKVE